jgi:hypothetical protein
MTIIRKFDLSDPESLMDFIESVLGTDEETKTRESDLAVLEAYAGLQIGLQRTCTLMHTLIRAIESPQYDSEIIRIFDAARMRGALRTIFAAYEQILSVPDSTGDPRMVEEQMETLSEMRRARDWMLG